MGPDRDDDDDSWEGEVSPDRTGPYFLRALIDHVTLSADGSENNSDAEITCVEVWEGNLYIGTSKGDVLHYVLVPAEASDIGQQPTYILASKCQPSFAPTASEGPHDVGIQQILLLPRAYKACILCNGTLTFYSLPELSPTFAATQVRNCNWVGGMDLSLDEDNAESQSELIMISLKSRIRLVRVGDDPRPVVVRNIEYAGSLITVRRGSFACVANGNSYALLDVEHQQKIPLFPISSLDATSSGIVGGEAEDLPSEYAARASRNRSASRADSTELTGDIHGHGRSTSLGALVAGLGRRAQSPRPRSQDQTGPEHLPTLARDLTSGQVQPHNAQNPGMADFPPRTSSLEKPLPVPPPAADAPSSLTSVLKPLTFALLRPHILSPTPDEFLLTTGTTMADRGVGIFVNMDGDVCRSTIDFERYPDDVAVDAPDVTASSREPPSGGSIESYVLAVIEKGEQGSGEKGIEIQALNGDTEDIWSQKAWLHVPRGPTSLQRDVTKISSNRVGIRKVRSACEISSEDLRKALQLVRLRLPSYSSNDSSQSRSHHAHLKTPGSEEALSGDGITGVPSQSSAGGDFNTQSVDPPETSRLREEEQFARRFSVEQSNLVLWAGNRIWSVVRNPLAMRLEALLEMAMSRSPGKVSVDRRQVIKLLNRIRGQESRTETHFLSLRYIRQKASLLLFSSLMEASSKGMAFTSEEISVTEDGLLEGAVEPRVLMIMVPFLRQDIVEGTQGIWVHGGVCSHVEYFISSHGDNAQTEAISEDLLHVLRRYLSAWRQKKGFGSMADEKQVFESVDSGLLHVLLQLDTAATATSGSSIRAELYALVDRSIDCFDRAVVLLERYRRLYVLSRLYHSRKMAGQVLATWKRILEGEVDEGGEFEDGENEVRKYLAKIRDAGLVEKYGTWLARRQPGFGVLVFSEMKSRVKFEPVRVIQILQEEAPEALREYLENLVLGRNMSEYANDLIGCYLDSVLSVLESSERARSILAESYETYRALRPPRPTYREFITENAIDERWWQDRLRLLQLLGGSQGAVSQYDVPLALSRIEPFERELVPEMIILDGKQARHQPALRLLIHGLGDYDSAINYCLLGGAGLFHPTFGATPSAVVPSAEEQATLFGYLLSEFLEIQDPGDRVEQTGGLLERFGRWYDARQVLSQIPDSWSVDLVSGFLVHALRRLLAERNETTVAKALSGAENLHVSARFIDQCEKMGSAVEGAD